MITGLLDFVDDAIWSFLEIWFQLLRPHNLLLHIPLARLRFRLAKELLKKSVENFSRYSVTATKHFNILCFIEI